MKTSSLAGRLLAFLFVCFAVVISTPSSAASVVFDEGQGQYIGIDDVLVNGDYYNARFVDGPFDPVNIQLYDSQFAYDASRVLYDLLKTGSFYGSDFDKNVTKTLGCEFHIDCYMATPRLVEWRGCYQGTLNYKWELLMVGI